MCNKAYSDKCSLINHKHIHGGQRHYSCEVCNKAFSQQSSLNVHQHMHSVQITDWCFQAVGEQGNLIKCQLIHCCMSVSS